MPYSHEPVNYLFGFGFFERSRARPYAEAGVNRALRIHTVSRDDIGWPRRQPRGASASGAGITRRFARPGAPSRLTLALDESSHESSAMGRLSLLSHVNARSWLRRRGRQSDEVSSGTA